MIDIDRLIEKLEEVRGDMLSLEQEYQQRLSEIHPDYKASAVNLLHYLALRKYDLREIQSDLSALGLSSVGHSERYTMRNISNILRLLYLVKGEDPGKLKTQEGMYMGRPESRLRLEENTARLFGPEKNGHTRIMVTLPTDAADDKQFIRDLLSEEVEIFRINTSHDSPEVWERMIGNIREAEREKGQRGMIYMDLAGPKIRTGNLPPRKTKKGKIKDGQILLRIGDELIITREERIGCDAEIDEYDRVTTPAIISTTLPEVFDYVEEGERIWFDDGKIGGIIETVTPEQWHVRITQAHPEGSKLRGDKGINLPDSDLQLPPLTEYDLETLPFIAKHADLVGYSFVQRAEDVLGLQEKLEELGRPDMGIVLKIETKHAFDELPNLIFEAMKSPAIGIMVARGDLAVELGWTRIAEVQEEIAWLCEAAHIPLIWATQILENQAKTGLATRAEITDAAAAVNAECAMLNKGPYITKAVKTLRSIDRRMHAHFEKKMGSLRPLHVATHYFKHHKP